jgi:ribosomal protein L24
VMLICPNCKQRTRVGIRGDSNGKNERFCKKCEQSIPRPDVD